MISKNKSQKITKKFLIKLGRMKGMYVTPELNTILYLQTKNIKKIENLEKYINLKTLYLNNNNIKKITGLEKLIQLEFLSLSHNSISKIENLDSLIFLEELDLSYNIISKIESISFEITNILKYLPNILLLDISGNSQLLQFDPFLANKILFCCPNLKNLNSNSIDWKQKKLAFAWIKGGNDLQNEVYLQIQEIEKEKERKRLNDFIEQFELDNSDLI
ncbi:dynein assembly factor 1 axonemal [Anaeramoeba ignava]|uniref:Dynein assembly factor 1 axonemal n=1 Tax=Anaeramoeba ignava TaxID=1746090 RepID=A0A9Q0LCD1_ANAIG|nr:dynein assembly factor 1 axonemal [Anaeramoeba ignava]